MRAIERIGIKTKKFLVVIAVVALDNQKDVLRDLNFNFIRIVQGVIEGDINDRNLTKIYYKRFKSYKEKGLIEKSGSLYILTRKAWGILGFDVVSSIYKNFPIRTEHFDIESFSKLKKEKKKKNFRREFLVEIGALGENNKLTIQMADYIKEFTRRIEKIFNLLNNDTNL